jgi:NitT/TauT family transport system ATP-binding protein
MQGPAFVKISEVSLVYQQAEEQTLAVEGLNIDIQEGEFVAVVGPSGCGKSTLMKLVTGLLNCSQGSITIGGKPVNGPVQGVGMAFQNSTLLPWRSTLDNVMLPLEIVEPHKRLLRKQKKMYIEKALDLLGTVGLRDFADKFPWQLSGGMQQRANVCRSIIHEPRLLMLDEPFGALDAFTREELWGVMQELWMKKKFTAILITHDLREATYLADRVFVMSKRPGKIILSKEIDIPRPRTLNTTFEPHFGEIVHELREHIHEVRVS